MKAVRGAIHTLAAVPRLGVGAKILIVVMLVLDAAVLGGNLIYLTVDEPHREATHPVFSDPMWNGDIDNSWMELAGHLQLVLAAVGCAVLWFRQRAAIYLVTAALLIWIAVDDAGRIHEAGGGLVRSWGVGPMLGIGAQSLGELGVWALAGAVMVLCYLAVWRSADALARRRTTSVLVGFALLLFFAMVVDTVDSMITPSVNSWIQTGMALMENGGELVAITLIATMVIVQVAGKDRLAPA